MEQTFTGRGTWHSSMFPVTKDRQTNLILHKQGKMCIASSPQLLYHAFSCLLFSICIFSCFEKSQFHPYVDGEIWTLRNQSLESNKQLNLILFLSNTAWPGAALMSWIWRLVIIVGPYLTLFLHPWLIYTFSLCILKVYVRPAGSYIMDQLELRRVALYPGINNLSEKDTPVLVCNFSISSGLRAAEAFLVKQQVIIPLSFL